MNNKDNFQVFNLDKIFQLDFFKFLLDKIFGSSFLQNNNLEINGLNIFEKKKEWILIFLFKENKEKMNLLNNFLDKKNFFYKKKKCIILFFTEKDKNYLEFLAKNIENKKITNELSLNKIITEDKINDFFKLKRQTQSQNNFVSQTNNNNNTFIKKQQHFGSSYFEVFGEIINVRNMVNSRTETIGKWRYFFEYRIENQKDELVYIAQYWAKTDEENDYLKTFKEGHLLNIRGTKIFNKYLEKEVINIKGIDNISLCKEKIITEIPKKELEIKNYLDKKGGLVDLHIHTNMSVMDGISNLEEITKKALKNGYKTIAFSDHLNIHNFPKIYKLQKQLPELKILYGVTMRFLEEKDHLFKNYFSFQKPTANLECIILDLETTGLYANCHEIIEFGYVILKNNSIINKGNFFIKSKKEITQEITNLTGITNDDLKNAPTLEETFPKIKKILQDRIIVAHNAEFDFAFLNKIFLDFEQINLKNIVIDTLNLVKILNPYLKTYRLEKVALYYKINYVLEKAHRALYDAEILAKILLKIMSENLLKNETELLFFLEKISCPLDFYKKITGKNINILVKNNEGFKDLYELITISNTENLFSKPKIFKKHLLKKRKNLLFAAGCYDNEIFNSLLNDSDEILLKKLKFYDYIEIMPINSYKHLFLRNKIDKTNLELKIAHLINLCLKEEIPFIFTSNSYYSEKRYKQVKEVIINNKLFGEHNWLYDFKNYSQNDIFYLPDQHLRNYEEIKEEFVFLNKKVFEKLIFKNVRLVLSKIESDLVPLKTKLTVPRFAEDDKNLENLVLTELEKKYGKTKNKVILERVREELEIIINNGYETIFLTASKLVKKSLEDGYVVGSRGSVGSSFVAYLLKITEINPLVSHYYCINRCQNNNYESLKIIENTNIASGYDLPSLLCEICGEKLISDGHDIPFSTFLNKYNKKIPDIDLNFSGEYQEKAHNFIRALFGPQNVYRIGTISTIAWGIAKLFVNEYQIKKKIKLGRDKQEELTQGLIGCKRTTGQHPGGVIIIPKDENIFNFTPLNFPANDSKNKFLTTHFPMEDLTNSLLKFDILGHDDPTILKELFEITSFKRKKFSAVDFIKTEYYSEILKLFRGELNFKTDNVPEFGTHLAKEMLKEIKPTSFADLVKVCGLAHGKGVWSDNAQKLIATKQQTIKTVISCRDDIVIYLIKTGISEKIAYNIANKVRNGLGLSKTEKKMMISQNIPQWYIESCEKIKYLFPKAHAVAYVLMAWKIAWFKINFPSQFYCIIFSNRYSTFDLNLMIAKTEKIKNKISLLEKKRFKIAKEKELIAVLKTTIEMQNRNGFFVKIDLNKASKNKFLLIKSKENNDLQKKNFFIMPSLQTIPSFGDVSVNEIIKLRKEKNINSFADLKDTKLTKANLKILKDLQIINE